jgi:peroxiredoxin
MYIPIGSDMSIRDETIIGIFDLDNTTCSKHTRNFLKQAEEAGQVVTVTDELPKAFVLTREFTMDRVYLTQFSAATIEKRSRRGK